MKAGVERYAIDLFLSLKPVCLKYDFWVSQVYCPKRGILKLVIEDDSESNGNETKEAKSLSSCIFDVVVDLKDCVLLPGSEVVFVFL